MTIRGKITTKVNTVVKKMAAGKVNEVEPIVDDIIQLLEIANDSHLTEWAGRELVNCGSI